MIYAPLASDIRRRHGIQHFVDRGNPPMRARLGTTMQGAWTQGTLDPVANPMVDPAEWETDDPIDTRRQHPMSAWGTEFNKWSLNSLAQPQRTPLIHITERAQAVQHHVWASGLVLRDKFFPPLIGGQAPPPPPATLFADAGWFHFGQFRDDNWDTLLHPSIMDNTAPIDLLRIMAKILLVNPTLTTRELADSIWRKVYQHPKPYGGGTNQGQLAFDVDRFMRTWYDEGQGKLGAERSPSPRGYRFLICQPYYNQLSALHVIEWPINGTLYFQAVCTTTQLGGIEQLGEFANLQPEQQLFQLQFTEPGNRGDPRAPSDRIFYYSRLIFETDGPGLFHLRNMIGMFRDPEAPPTGPAASVDAFFDGPPGSESIKRFTSPLNLPDQVARTLRVAVAGTGVGARRRFEFRWPSVPSDSSPSATSAAYAENATHLRLAQSQSIIEFDMRRTLAGDAGNPESEYEMFTGGSSASADWLRLPTAMLNRVGW